MNLYVYVFWQIWKVFSHRFFEDIFNPTVFLLSSSLWWPKYQIFCHSSIGPESLFIFQSVFSPWFRWGRFYNAVLQFTVFLLSPPSAVSDPLSSIFRWLYCSVLKFPSVSFSYPPFLCWDALVLCWRFLLFFFFYLFKHVHNCTWKHLYHGFFKIIMRSIILASHVLLVLTPLGYLFSILLSPFWFLLWQGIFDWSLDIPVMFWDSESYSKLWF